MKSAFLLAATLVMTVTYAAQAHDPDHGPDNLLANGSFEQDAPTSGCVAGTTAVAGWVVTAGNVDIDSNRSGCTTIPAIGGRYWIDLTGSFGSGAGTLQQTVATIIGARYRLSFWFGGNPEWQPQCASSGYANDGPVKSMNVAISGAVPVVANYSRDTTGQSCSDAAWIFEAITFTATSTATTISFESLDASGVYGPLLDDVRLQEECGQDEPGRGRG